jgi:hypothetical protein
MLDDILNYMHGTARSAHFHAGEFPSGELDRIDALMSHLMDADTVQLDSLHWTCYELTREAIVNWLTDILPDEPVTSIDDTGAANSGATAAKA